ncbi:hypothetical protein BD414DRAFT_473378 [Trametes punicea]|nr:hypothetical protein BD414DRAFT_473378 [Trametes punicea]
MSTHYPRLVSFPRDDENPLTAQVLHNPDFRATAGFLLGCVFWSSISFLYRSQFFQLLARVCWRFVRSRHDPCQTNDVEAPAPLRASKGEIHGRAIGPFDDQSSLNGSGLVFTLNLCFCFASLAKFCSILAYDAGRADPACAFTIAWGSMADQAAHLVGLLILCLGLKQRYTMKIEFGCLCAALVVLLSFILAFNATNTGNVVSIQALGVAICVKDRFLPTAILVSCSSILIDLYVLIRSLSWEDPKAGMRSLFLKSANLPVARACSLLLIDVLTLAPNVVMTNVLAQFAPFSFGALIVLTSFNYGMQSNRIKGESPVYAPSHSHTVPLRPTPRSVERSRVQLAEESREQSNIIIIDTPNSLPLSVSGSPPRATALCSAPPRIGEASISADTQERQILPLQVQYAERLERHIHTGPIVPMRSRRRRPRIQVVTEAVESVKAPTDTPLTILGSDIVRLPSAVAASRSRREIKLWSPSSGLTTSDLATPRTSSAATPTTTVRDSNMSMGTYTFAPSRFARRDSRHILSGALSRQTSKKARSPTETSLRMPSHGAPRTSLASGRTFGGPDALPLVAEGNMEGAPSNHASGSWRERHPPAKRLLISRPHSLRASREANLHTTCPVGMQLAVVSTTGRPSTSSTSSSLHLAVPAHQRSPISPCSPLTTRPSSGQIAPKPASSPSTARERAKGSGRLRGPRSPPGSSSFPSLRSAWPTIRPDAQEDGKGHMRRRSDSCPELPPLDVGAPSL